MTKMNSIAAKLIELHSHQNTPYHFVSDAELIDVIKAPAKYLTEDDQYSRSLELEPKIST